MATEIQQVKISQLNTISDWRNAHTVATDRNGQSVKAPIEQVSKIGDLSTLTTSAKTTLVAAINEAATTGNVTVDSALSSSSTNPVENRVINAALGGKQDTLIGSGTGQNIKTINNQSILGSGNITIQAGDTDAVKYVAQTLTDAQKAQARANIGAENGVGFDSITTPSTPDGTMIITLTNGDTITMDLNHNHPQYPKYVYCSSQAAYDAITTKESDTLYLILETS